MNLEEKWEQAVRETQIIRYRLRSLLAFDATELNYIVLGASSINVGDTVVHKGKVVVHQPLIIMPHGHRAQFEGFSFEEDMHLSGDDIRRFLLMRGVSFPKLKYRNEICDLDVYEGDLDRAVGYFTDQLERREDVQCGLMSGPEDAWEFSVLMYVAAMAARSASSDIDRILEELRQNKYHG